MSLNASPLNCLLDLLYPVLLEKDINPTIKCMDWLDVSIALIAILFVSFSLILNTILKRDIIIWL